MILFGDHITIHHRLTRQKSNGMAMWKARPTEPNRVLVIGRRTLYNGHTYQGRFVRTESVKALLVAADERETFYIYDLGE